MKALFIALLFLLAGCTFSDIFDTETTYWIDERFAGYVDRFYDEGVSRGRSFRRNNLMMVMGSKSHSFRIVDQRLIEIDSVTYNILIRNLRLYDLESLIFHELGHSLLDRDHTSAISVMSYEHMFTPHLKNPCVKRLYYDELFLKIRIERTDLSRCD